MAELRIHTRKPYRELSLVGGGDGEKAKLGDDVDKESKPEKKETDREKAKKAEVQRLNERVKAIRMSKLAFADTTWAQKLNFCPHVILVVQMLFGVICILFSVGAFWMKADVGTELTVSYGLFERCVYDHGIGVTLCEWFNWSNFVIGNNQGRMMGVVVLSVLSVVFAAAFVVGSVVLLMTRSYCGCRGSNKRKACLIIVDVWFWLMVGSAAITSILYLTGWESLEAYPNSVLLWPPIIHCGGWCMAIVARLLVAACCDVHRDHDHNDTNAVSFI